MRVYIKFYSLNGERKKLSKQLINMRNQVTVKIKNNEIYKQTKKFFCLTEAPAIQYNSKSVIFVPGFFLSKQIELVNVSPQCTIFCWDFLLFYCHMRCVLFAPVHTLIIIKFNTLYDIIAIIYNLQIILFFYDTLIFHTCV